MTSPTDDAAAKYGAIGQMVASVPELKPIFDQATAEGWTSDRFVLAIQNTNWWKTSSDTTRDYVNQYTTDPATWQQNVNSKADSVWRMAVQMGYGTNDPALAADIARLAWINGWSDDQVKGQIVARYQMEGGADGGFGGQSADLISQMQKISQDYGVRSDTSQNIAQWTKDIQSGTKTIQQYQDLAKSSAISAYPGIRSMIEKGLTVADIAAPYISTYANLLEVDPNAVDFGSNTLIKKALQGTGTVVDAGGVPVQTPLWQFEAQVKQDPAWGYTKNAKREVDSVANRIGQDFGFLS